MDSSLWEALSMSQGDKEQNVYCSPPLLTITMDPFSCLPHKHTFWFAQQRRQEVFAYILENESLTCGQGLSLRSQMSLFCRCDAHCVYLYHFILELFHVSVFLLSCASEFFLSHSDVTSNFLLFFIILKICLKTNKEQNFPGVVFLRNVSYWWRFVRHSHCLS